MQSNDTRKIVTENPIKQKNFSVYLPLFAKLGHILIYTAIQNTDRKNFPKDSLIKKHHIDLIKNNLFSLTFTKPQLKILNDFNGANMFDRIVKEVQGTEHITYNLNLLKAGKPAGKISSHLKKTTADFISSKKRFLALPLGIRGNSFGHYNILFFDKKKKTIEHFEPYGYNNMTKFQDNVDKDLEKLFSKMNFKYIGVKETNISLGPQFFEEKISKLNTEYLNIFLSKKTKEQVYNFPGYCVVWSLYYIFNKVVTLNEIETKEIFKFDNLLQFYLTIRKFAEDLIEYILENDPNIMIFVNKLKFLYNSTNECKNKFIPGKNFDLITFKLPNNDKFCYDRNVLVNHFRNLFEQQKNNPFKIFYLPELKNVILNQESLDEIMNLMRNDFAVKQLTSLEYKII